MYVNGNVLLLEYYASKERWDAAIERGHEALSADYLKESVHRRVIDLYCRNGERAKARTHFEMLSSSFAEDYQTALTPETEALGRTI
jgi:DNA-binding SARP family transcriptional activator